MWRLYQEDLSYLKYLRNTWILSVRKYCIKMFLLDETQHTQCWVLLKNRFFFILFLAMEVKKTQLLILLYENWKMAQIFSNFLIIFYEATFKISCSLYMISNVLSSNFVQLCKFWKKYVNVRIRCWWAWCLIWNLSLINIGGAWIGWAWLFMLLLSLNFDIRLHRYHIGWKGAMGMNVEIKVNLLLNNLIERYYKFHGQCSESSSNMVYLCFSSTISDGLECEDFDIVLNQYFEERVIVRYLA